jgi:hypothetical protein
MTTLREVEVRVWKRTLEIDGTTYEFDYDFNDLTFQEAMEIEVKSGVKVFGTRGVLPASMVAAMIWIHVKRVNPKMPYERIAMEKTGRMAALTRVFDVKTGEMLPEDWSPDGDEQLVLAGVDSDASSEEPAKGDDDSPKDGE